MTVAEGKAAARSYFEQLLNSGDMAVADAIFTPGVRFQYPLCDLKGLQAVKNYIAAVQEALPDIVFTVADLFGEDDHVAARWALTATQTGPLARIRSPPPVNAGVRLLRKEAHGRGCLYWKSSHHP